MVEEEGPSDRGEPASSFDVVVVGAGQAGLAIGHFLTGQSRRFVILEAGSSVGEAWRGRWDSLALFTPGRYDSLPGLPFPGDPDAYPGRDEVIEYLERYVATFDLPVEVNSPVRSLTEEDGKHRLEVDGRTLIADQVVVATGPFQSPYVPEFADQLAPEVVQMHSTGYRNPGDVPEGTVLVVGGGNTGFQIAKELAATNQVHLSIGSRQISLPQRILGRDLFWCLTKLGLLQKSVETRLGRRIRDRGSPLIGSSPKDIERSGVALRPRATAIVGRTVRFEDGSELDVDAVIWATGYRPEYSWIHIDDVVDNAGGVRQRRGVTDRPGLYFVGLEWQYTRGSALLGWVKDDAAFIARQIDKYQASQRPSHAPPVSGAKPGTRPGERR